MPDHVASVFVSHARVDEVFVQEFCAQIETSGGWMWIDQDRLPVGGSQPARISDAIDKVDFCVVLVSAGYVDSDWCQWELSLAVSTAIGRKMDFVLPVRVDGTPMPGVLRDKCYVDARKMGPRLAADKVMDSVREHLMPTMVIPPRRVRQSVGQRRAAPSGTTRPPRRRVRQSVLLGAVLALLSAGPVSPVASYSVVEPGRHWGHLPYN